jgi:hypothetical protein
MTWTHHQIFWELCIPEKLPEFNCNPEVEILTCHLSEEQVSQQKKLSQADGMTAGTSVKLQNQ